jgi:spore germination protein KB
MEVKVVIEKGRISSAQMFFIMYASTIVTGSTYEPNLVGQYAGRDLWLSPIWGVVSSFSSFFLAVALNNLYPKDTIVKYSRKILGFIPGALVGLLYILIYFHVDGFVIREYAELIKGVILPQTPMVVVMAGIALLAASAVRGGIETMARTVQLLVPPAFIMWALTLTFTIKDWDMKHMFPILEHGLVPTLKGATVIMTWLGDFFLTSFLLPHLSDRQKAVRWGILAILASMLSMIIFKMVPLFVFGPETFSYKFPYYEVFRYISLAEFIEHIDSLLLAVWVVLVFVKLCLYHYIIVLGAAEWFNLSNYSFLSLPVALIVISLGIWTVPNSSYLAYVLSTRVFFYSQLVQIVIPASLLVIAWIRRKIRSASMAAGG